MNSYRVPLSLATDFVSKRCHTVLLHFFVPRVSTHTVLNGVAMDHRSEAYGMLCCGRYVKQILFDGALLSSVYSRAQEEPMLLWLPCYSV